MLEDLRDWMAGQALVGLLAFSPQDSDQLGPKDAAAEAYRMADAMLEARQPKPKLAAEQAEPGNAAA